VGQIGQGLPIVAGVVAFGGQQGVQVGGQRLEFARIRRTQARALAGLDVAHFLGYPTQRAQKQHQDHDLGGDDEDGRQHQPAPEIGSKRDHLGTVALRILGRPQGQIEDLPVRLLPAQTHGVHVVVSGRVRAAKQRLVALDQARARRLDQAVERGRLPVTGRRDRPGIQPGTGLVQARLGERLRYRRLTGRIQIDGRQQQEDRRGQTLLHGSLAGAAKAPVHGHTDERQRDQQCQTGADEQAQQQRGR